MAIQLPQLSVDEVRQRYTADIQGRAYLKVAGRVLLFRAEHPEGRIITEPLQITDEYAIFKAKVYLTSDARSPHGVGHARIDAAQAKNTKGRFVEMAETNAIGRALGMCGYGTDELVDDDADAIADSPVAAPPRPDARAIAGKWWKEAKDRFPTFTDAQRLEALGVAKLGDFDWLGDDALAIAHDLLDEYIQKHSDAALDPEPPPEKPAADPVEEELPIKPANNNAFPDFYQAHVVKRGLTLTDLDEATGIEKAKDVLNWNSTEVLNEVISQLEIYVKAKKKAQAKPQPHNNATFNKPKITGDFVDREDYSGLSDGVHVS